MRQVLRDVDTRSLSPLVHADSTRTLARISRVLHKAYTATGSHHKAEHQRALATELYAEAGDRYARTRHYDDAARMYRAVGLVEKAEEVERIAEQSLRRLRRDVLGTSTLVLLGGFLLIGLVLLFPSALGQVIAPLSYSRSSFFLVACSILILVVAWMERCTVALWWRGFTAIFK